MKGQLAVVQRHDEAVGRARGHLDLDGSELSSTHSEW
jgi:hypothetical protein